jgi:hypothetical protein
LRLVNGFAQAAQILVGRSVFFTPRGMDEPFCAAEASNPLDMESRS